MYSRIFTAQPFLEGSEGGREEGMRYTGLVRDGEGMSRFWMSAGNKGQTGAKARYDGAHL